MNTLRLLFGRETASTITGDDFLKLIGREEFQKNKLLGSDIKDEAFKATNKSNQVERSVATIEIIASREDNTRLYR